MSAPMTPDREQVRAELMAEFVAWLVKKAREHRAKGPQYAKQADVIGRLADKVSRGAVRPNNLLLLPAQGGPEDAVLAAQVAEHGPFPMPVGEPMPVELTGQQLGSLIDAGNRAVNDHYHEDQCHCDSWPTSCVSSGNYFMGAWDTNAFAIGLPAVLGVWESLRNDRHAAKIAELRADNERLSNEVAAFRSQRNEVFKTNEELLSRVERSDLTRLQAENENRTLQRRVAELESSPDDAACGSSTRTHRCVRDENHPGQHRAADGTLWPRRGQTVPAASPEDPHDSPLHHTYETPRDLPSMTADTWNNRYPVGTPVLAYPVTRDDEGLTTVTRSRAWTLGHGAAVVSVDGYGGGICLTHVDPLPGGTP